MRNRTKRTLLGCILCVIISSLPFVTLATSLGIETMVDTYQHPDHYHYLKDTQPSASYLILQDVPETDLLQKGDTILFQDNDNIKQGIITAINTNTDVVYTTTGLITPIHPHEILGRLTASLTPNPWTLLCLQLWDLTTHTLNPCTLLPL